MTDFLVATIVILSVVQPTRDRIYVATIFAFAVLLHNLFLSGLDGLAYYGAAALVDFGIIAATAALPRITEMTIQIHKVCLTAILVNMVGWIMWMLYYPPILYNIAFIAVYGWAIVILIKREQADDQGNDPVDHWRSNIRSNGGSRNHHNPSS